MNLHTFSIFNLKIDLRKLCVTRHAMLGHCTVQPRRHIYLNCAVQVKMYGVPFFSVFFSYHKGTSLNRMKMDIAMLYVDTTTSQVAANLHVVTSNESLLLRQFFLPALLVGISYIQQEEGRQTGLVTTGVGTAF
jgi:hypothetical protein